MCEQALLFAIGRNPIPFIPFPLRRGRGIDRKRGSAPLRHPIRGRGIIDTRFGGGAKREFKGGFASLPYTSPSPLKERGIKGVR